MAQLVKLPCISSHSRGTENNFEFQKDQTGITPSCVSFTSTTNWFCCFGLHSKTQTVYFRLTAKWQRSKKKKTSSCISKGFWFLLLIRDSVSQGALSYNNIQQLDFQSFGTTLYIWLCINSVCWATLASRIKITQAVFYLFPNHSLRLHCKCWYVVPVSTGTSFALCKQRLF